MTQHSQANESKSKDLKESEEDQVNQINTESILKSIIKFLNYNLRDLFQNKPVDEELINHIIKLCFDILEVPNEVKNVSVKERTFDTLKLIVTKYNNHNTTSNLMLIKLTNKITNLIFTYVIYD